MVLVLDSVPVAMIVLRVEILLHSFESVLRLQIVSVVKSTPGTQSMAGVSAEVSWRKALPGNSMGCMEMLNPKSSITFTCKLRPGQERSSPVAPITLSQILHMKSSRADLT